MTARPQRGNDVGRDRERRDLAARSSHGNDDAHPAEGRYRLAEQLRRAGAPIRDANALGPLDLRCLTAATGS
jgi:hypothetical protein